MVPKSLGKEPQPGTGHVDRSRVDKHTKLLAVGWILVDHPTYQELPHITITDTPANPRGLNNQVGKGSIFRFRRSASTRTQSQFEGKPSSPERYEETYWSRWPDIWLHGDRPVILDDGSAMLPGRSDDVMNIGGKRVGPSEYESIATSLDDGTSAAVGVPDPVKGEVAVLLITAMPGSDEDSLAARIRERVDALMGEAMRPKDVIVVSILPLTVSGKVHRRAIRAWLTGTDPGDLSGAQHLECRAEISRHAARIAAPPYTEGASARAGASMACRSSSPAPAGGSAGGSAGRSRPGSPARARASCWVRARATMSRTAPPRYATREARRLRPR